MPEDRDALLAHYRQSRDHLLKAIDGLTEEQLTERTLDGWSVKDHLAHIAIWDEIRAAEVERISAGHASTWRMSPQQEAGFGPIAYDLRKDLSVAHVMWELNTTRQRFLDAVAAATPTGLDGSRYGEAGLRSMHEAVHTAWIQRWRTEKGY